MTMEKELTFGLMMPLKDISLRRVANILWCRSDILFDLDFCDVESKVKDSMTKLVLPPLLIEEMNYLVKPIGSELKNWKNFHEEYLEIEDINMFGIAKHLSWTILGNLDYQKTAESLIRHETFDTVTRYRLACLYCLDAYIPNLWEKLPEEKKDYFYKEEGPLELSEPQLEFCWPYILKGEETRLDYVPLNPFGERVTFYQCAFEYSAHKGNKAASEYFFRKLPYGVSPDSLIKLGEKVLIRGCERRFEQYSYDDFPAGKIVNIFFHLLSLMKHEQLAEFFEDHACKVLVSLLDWPWQNVFLHFVELLRNFLDTDKCFFILEVIFLNMQIGFDHRKLFQEYFLRGSSDFINTFMEEELTNVSVLRWLIKKQDSQTIKVIFRKLDSVQRQTVVSCETVFELFCESISDGQWPVVELCLKEATLSQENKEQLKQIYVGFLPNVNEDMSVREYIWNQFLYFFDENRVLISSKRKSAEEDLTKYKKKSPRKSRRARRQK